MNLDTAIKLATDAHAGQVDKAGEPYILHPFRVRLAMKTDEERIVAVLHDVVEDTPWTCDDLYWQHGFKREIVMAVVALNRPGTDGDVWLGETVDGGQADKKKLAHGASERLANKM